jgi:hypothetical protein
LKVFPGAILQLPQPCKDAVVVISFPGGGGPPGGPYMGDASESVEVDDVDVVTVAACPVVSPVALCVVVGVMVAGAVVDAGSAQAKTLPNMMVLISRISRISFIKLSFVHVMRAGSLYAPQRHQRHNHYIAMVTSFHYRFESISGRSLQDILATACSH